MRDPMVEWVAGISAERAARRGLDTVPGAAPKVVHPKSVGTVPAAGGVSGIPTGFRHGGIGKKRLDGVRSYTADADWASTAVGGA